MDEEDSGRPSQGPRSYNKVTAATPHQNFRFSDFVKNLEKTPWMNTSILATIPKKATERVNEHHIIDKLADEMEEILPKIEAVTPTQFWFCFIITMKDEEHKDLLINKGIQIGSIIFDLRNLRKKYTEIKLHRVRFDIRDESITEALARDGFTIKGAITNQKKQKKNCEIDVGVRRTLLQLTDQQSEEDIPDRIMVEGTEILIRHKNDTKWCNLCKTTDHFSKFCKKQTCICCKKFGHHWRLCKSTKEAMKLKKSLGMEAFPTLEESMKVFKETSENKAEKESIKTKESRLSESSEEKPMETEKQDTSVLESIKAKELRLSESSEEEPMEAEKQNTSVLERLPEGKRPCGSPMRESRLEEDATLAAKEKKLRLDEKEALKDEIEKEVTKAMEEKEPMNQALRKIWIQNVQKARKMTSTEEEAKYLVKGKLLQLLPHKEKELKE